MTTETLEATPDQLHRYNMFSIELDAPPFQPRPNELIGSVLKDTGFTVEDFDTAPPFFGHQTWILKAEVGKDELFRTMKPTFKERVTELYNSGAIRYGTW